MEVRRKPALSEVEGPALSRAEGPALSEVEGAGVGGKGVRARERETARRFFLTGGPEGRMVPSRTCGEGGLGGSGRLSGRKVVV